jgi:hypothetical protein
MENLFTQQTNACNRKLTSVFYKVLFVLFFVCSSSFVFAQAQYPVTVQPTIIFPSVFISDYDDAANLNVRVTLHDASKTNYGIMLKVIITGPNYKAISHTGIPLTLQPNEPIILNDLELAALFNTSNLDITNSATSGTSNPNVIPEGIYVMSFEAYDALLPGPVIVSNKNTDFTSFSVNRFDPPMLNLPATKQVFDLTTINQNVFFSWTPRAITYSPKQKIKYSFRLTKVIPADRNPYDAMNSMDPKNTGNIYVDDLDFPVFIYTPTELALEEGCVYAWQVKAYEQVTKSDGTTDSSSACFKNLGLSEVFTFSIKENCQPVTPIATPQIAGNQVTLGWTEDPSHKSYELDYRPAGTNLPWTPVTTATNSYVLDNTVLQTGVTYEYTIRAMCKNWIDPVYAGTFSLTTPDCSAPTPLTVDNTSSDQTVINWPSVNGATSYVFQYVDLVNPTDPFLPPVDLLSTDNSYSLPKPTSGNYKIRVDAVCNTETAEGVPYTVSVTDNGVVGPCPIPTPFQLIATRVNGDVAQLAWSTNAVYSGYSITFWERDSSTFQRTLTSTDPNVTANMIYDDQLYAYQITFNCGNKQITTPVGMFRIDGATNGVVTDAKTGNCFPPAVIQGEPRSTTSALLDWSKVDGVDGYQLFYSVKGAKQFQPFNTISNSALIKPLDDSKQYQFIVRSRCGTDFSIYSDTALVDLSAGKSNANCDSAAYFITKGQTTTEIRLRWPYAASNTGYKLTYREEAQSPADAYTQAFTDIVAFNNDHLVANTDSLVYTFDNLKPGTPYIFELQVLCGTDAALSNYPLRVSTVADAKTSGSCGGTPSCDKTNVTPLASLAPGDSIHCADYGIVVDQVTSSSPGTGTYSGTGHMDMPIPGLSDLVQMSVSFNDVKINAQPNSCIYDGTINIDSVNASVLPQDLRDKVKTISDQVDNVISTAQKTLTDTQNGIDQAQAALQTATDYFQGGNTVGNVVTGDLGETPTSSSIPVNTTTASVGSPTSNGIPVTIGGTTVNVPSVPALIKDGTGNVFQVAPDGTLTHVGVYDPTLAGDPTLDLSNGRVVFQANSTAAYDFDAWQSAYAGHLQVEREYEKITTDYYVPAKLLLPDVMDKVDAVLSGSYDKSKIKFANSKGMVYDATSSGNTFTINLAGGPGSDGQNIYAWFVDGSTQMAIGKLLAPSYTPQQKNVVLIPMGKSINRITAASATGYQNMLNATYGRLGITYTVIIDPTFKDNLDWDTGHDTGTGDGLLVPQGSKLTSNDYQGEEAAMINTYVAFKGGASSIDNNTGYFFVMFEAPVSDDQLVGKMPATEQFGFLFAGVAPDLLLQRTVAHELGHGEYHLEHTFQEVYLGASTRGLTDNLMDYNNAGTAINLWKYQWDIVYDPGHVWGILERDKDSEAKIDKVKQAFCSALSQINERDVLSGSQKTAIEKVESDAANNGLLTPQLSYSGVSNANGDFCFSDWTTSTFRYYLEKLYCSGVNVRVHHFSTTDAAADNGMDYTIWLRSKTYTNPQSMQVIPKDPTDIAAKKYENIGNPILAADPCGTYCALLTVIRQIAIDRQLKADNGVDNLFLTPTTNCSNAVSVTTTTKPILTLTADKTQISEDAESAIVTATINTAQLNDMVVTLSFVGSTATLSDPDPTLIDCTIPTTITIPAGQLTGTVTLTSIKDLRTEPNEIVQISVSDVSMNNVPHAAYIGDVVYVPQIVQITIEEQPHQTFAVVSEIKTYIDLTGNVKVMWKATGTINTFKMDSFKGGPLYDMKVNLDGTTGYYYVNIPNNIRTQKLVYQVATMNANDKGPDVVTSETGNFQGDDCNKCLCDQEVGAIGSTINDKSLYSYIWTLSGGSLPPEFATTQADALSSYPYVQFTYNGKQNYTLARTHTGATISIIDYGNVLIDPLTCTWKLIARDSKLPPGSNAPREAFNNQVLQLVEPDQAPTPANGVDAVVLIDGTIPIDTYGKRFPKWNENNVYQSGWDKNLTNNVTNNDVPSNNQTIGSGIDKFDVNALGRQETVNVEYFQEDKTPVSMSDINDPSLNTFINSSGICNQINHINDALEQLRQSLAPLQTIGLGIPDVLKVTVGCSIVSELYSYNRESYGKPTVVTDFDGKISVNVSIGDIAIGTPLIAGNLSLALDPLQFSYDANNRSGSASEIDFSNGTGTGKLQLCVLKGSLCADIGIWITVRNSTTPGCAVEMQIGYPDTPIYGTDPTGLTNAIVKIYTLNAGTFDPFCIMSK